MYTIIIITSIIMIIVLFYYKRVYIYKYIYNDGIHNSHEKQLTKKEQQTKWLMNDKFSPWGVVPSSFRQQYMQVHGPHANCQLNRLWHWEEDNRYSN